MKIHMVFLAPQGESILNQKKNSFFVTRLFFGRDNNKLKKKTRPKKPWRLTWTMKQ